MAGYAEDSARTYTGDREFRAAPERRCSYFAKAFASRSTRLPPSPCHEIGQRCQLPRVDDVIARHGDASGRSLGLAGRDGRTPATVRASALSGFLGLQGRPL